MKPSLDSFARSIFCTLDYPITLIIYSHPSLHLISFLLLRNACKTPDFVNIFYLPDFLMPNLVSLFTCIRTKKKNSGHGKDSSRFFLGKCLHGIGLKNTKPLVMATTKLQLNLAAH